MLSTYQCIAQYALSAEYTFRHVLLSPFDHLKLKPATHPRAPPTRGETCTLDSVRIAQYTDVSTTFDGPICFSVSSQQLSVDDNQNWLDQSIGQQLSLVLTTASADRDVIKNVKNTLM